MINQSKQRILITSALPYINGIKHLGNLAGSMLPADVQARFRRANGHEVLFLCATDEHGTPAELGAAAEGQDVAAYCAEQHEIQKRIYRDFNLSFDHFGRSSSAENRKLTQDFAAALEQNGLIEERVSRQVYSIDDGRFLPDRYVEGTCPHCSFPDARGDQCDNCGKQIDPTELGNPRSKISGSHNLELRDTAHLFLNLDKMQDRVRAWVDGHTDWPNLTKSIALKWLNEGLEARSITRDLSWGIPVVGVEGQPRKGFENKVYYVWFDAPIEYIACGQEWAAATGKNWQRWWRTDSGANDVQYIEFMGKDNVAFHTVNFPATILGAAANGDEKNSQPWKLVDQLKSFNWVTWYGDKFSTSQKRGVFLDQALELLPADMWRWYLMANAPESDDSAFTWEHFQATCNSDLGNVFGNFINRIVKFTAAKMDGTIPTWGSRTPLEDALGCDLAARLEKLTQLHEAMEYRKAAAETRAIWVRANEYLTDVAPWTQIKESREAAATGVRMGLELCVLCARIAAPFIPHTADTVLAAFGLKAETLGWPAGLDQARLNMLQPGQMAAPLPILFARIEDEWVATQSERFGGSKQA